MKTELMEPLHHAAYSGIVNIKNEARKVDAKKEKNENEKTNEENKDVKKEEKNEQKISKKN